MRELAHRQLISELGGRDETLKLKRDAAKRNRAWQKPEGEYNLAKVRERIGIPIWEIW